MSVVISTLIYSASFYSVVKILVVAYTAYTNTRSTNHTPFIFGWLKNRANYTYSV